MEKEFIPYELTLALKELGFDEPCFGFYKEFGDKWLIMMPTQLTQYEQNNLTSCIKTSTLVEVPTFSQAFRWFRDEYDLYSHVRESYSFDNTLEFVSQINGSYVNHGISDKPINRFETHEEAELECLKQLIEIVKTK